MAIAKTARVVGSERTSGGTCIIELEIAEPLGFVGGQYLIIDSGLVLPTGKAAKRAYSIFTSDADQRRFRLAVKRIPDGLVSAFMHGVAPGTTIPFSGPWGKLGPPERPSTDATGGSNGGTPSAANAGATSAPNGGATSISNGGATNASNGGSTSASNGGSTSVSNDGATSASNGAGATVILATDTGISAALGLVQAARMRAGLPTTVVIWLQVDGDDFLPEHVVRGHIPAGTGEVRFAALPPIGHPERIPYARSVLAAALARAEVARGYLTGDGAVNYALLDDLVAAGVPATRDSVESFFNMPKKSA